MRDKAAFPGLHPSKDCQYKDQGMTLRQWYAGMAMQGLISNSNLREVPNETIAKAAFCMADAMLKAEEDV